MWNGAPGSSTASAPASAPANASASRNAPSLVACMCAKSRTGRTKSTAPAIATTSSTVPEVAHAAHHLDAERDEPVLRLEPLAEVAELVDDVRDRLLPLAAEQEAGMEDDQLRAARLREPGGVVEHPERHLELLAAVGVAHERRERRVDGERDVGRGGGFAEQRRGVVVEPEAAGEAELARAVARCRERGERVLEVSACGSSAGPKRISPTEHYEVEPLLRPDRRPQHGDRAAQSCRAPVRAYARLERALTAVRPCFYVFGMPKRPSTHRPARARHRPPPRRPLARDRAT